MKNFKSIQKALNFSGLRGRPRNRSKEKSQAANRPSSAPPNIRETESPDKVTTTPPRPPPKTPAGRAAHRPPPPPPSSMFFNF